MLRAWRHCFENGGPASLWAATLETRRQSVRILPTHHRPPTITQYTFTRYSNEDRNEVLRLQRRLWGHNAAANSDYFCWKYESTPYLGPPLIYLAWHQNQLVGMRGFWRGEWRQGQTGPELPILSAGDTVVRLDHESRGLFRRIMEFAVDDLKREGYRCIVNFSAGPVTFLQSIRSGWKSIQAYESVRSEATRVWKLVDWAQSRLRSSSLVRWPNSGRLLFSAMESAVSRSLGGGLTISRTPRASEMERIGIRSPSDTRISHATDIRYLDWRFRNPLSCYRFLYWDDGELRGFLVLQRPRSGRIRQLNILDWQGDTRETKRALLNAALKLAGPSRVTTWTVGMTDINKQLLREAGFAPFDESSGVKRYRPSLLVRPIDGAEHNMVNPESWDIRMLFSDAF